MTTKAAFNADEWSELANAPYLVALLMVASSSGGTLRETVAISRAYAEARQHYGDELLQQLLSTPPAFDPTTMPHNPDELRGEAIAALRRAVSILERAGTQDELDNYKRFVYFLAETVARAHREGGFLGIGGKPISDPEQTVLDEIAAIFDEPGGGAGTTAS